MLSSISRTAAELISPTTLDFWASELGTTARTSRIMARINAVRTEARNTVSLELKANRNFKGFLPGQHINLTVEINGVRETRSYSLTGIPNGRYLSITAKQVAGGKVSSWLCNQARVGDVVEISNAFGSMTIPERRPEKIVLIAAGSGITPMMSLVRSLTSNENMNTECSLLYWAKTSADVCFANELAVRAKKHEQFDFKVFLTEEGDSRPSRESLGDLANQTIYTCGPGEFVASVRSLVADRAAEFHEESFTPATRITQRLGSVRVELKRSGNVVELPAGQPILDALEAQGIQPAYGCRQGICRSCVCAKLDGSSRDLQDGSINNQPDNALRLCVSAAASDLILDL